MCPPLSTVHRLQVYEGLAGLEADQKKVKPYLLVWLHGMDTGSIEPGYHTTLQKRLRHRVIFLDTRPISQQILRGFICVTFLNMFDHTSLI
jgi:hypothetical protein